MTSTPLWLRADERPLQAWLHRPETRDARGGVVICPPLGLDLSHTHFNLRLLASKLQALGFIVVRFDYDGTGQSAGDMSDGGRVEAWIASIACAAELARDAGAEWLAAVGVRLGATLAACAAVEAATFDTLVLWDPYASGRSFLREQAALKIGLQPPLQDNTPGIAVPGYVVSSETALELDGLELPAAPAIQTSRTLVLTDPARPDTRAVTRRLAGPRVDRRDDPDASRLIDIGALGYIVPHTLLDEVAAWVAASCAREPTPHRAVPRGPASATVAHSADGTAVVESFLSLGPLGMFGIACRGIPPDTQTDTQAAPTVFFLSIAAESSIGPVRQWVDYARRLAAVGIPSVRFDFSGVGESQRRPGQPERPLYAPEAIEDIHDAVEAVCGGHTHNAVLVGLCSGAYAALVAGRSLQPGAVVAINPLMTLREFESHDETTATDPTGASGARMLVRPKVLTPRAWLRRLRSIGRGSEWRTRVLEALPPWLWRLAAGAMHAHSPARLLDVTWKQDVPTLLVCGEAESEAPKRYAPRALRRLAAARSSYFVEIPSLNHALLHHQNREEIFELLRDYLAEIASAAPIRRVGELESAVPSADAMTAVT